MTPLLKPTSPPAVPFAPTKTSPLANEEAIVPRLSPTRPPTDTCSHELLNEQPSPPLLTPAVAITSPLADEPKMIEPGALNPTSPPNVTLMPALLTLTLACEPMIWPPWPPKLKPPLAPTSPPSDASVAVPPLTLPLAMTLLTVPRFVPASVPTIWNVTPGLAVTLTLARLRSRTTPLAPITPNRPITWVLPSLGAMVRLLIV